MSSNDPVPDHLAHLPIGVPIPMPDRDSIPGWEIFPFEYDGLRVKQLQPPQLPEPPRHGEDGPAGCGGCDPPEDQLIWSDDDWIVTTFGPSSVPAMLILRPRAHLDLGDLPPRLLADMGRLIGRLEEAVMAVDGVARVHFNKWGDGAAHLHWLVMARPAGISQLRGSCLVVWDDVLPNIDDEVHRANAAVVAAALAAGGGRNHLA